MQCPHCHASVDASLVFCPECGKRLTTTLPPIGAQPLPDPALTGGAAFHPPPFESPAAHSTGLAQASRWLGLVSVGVMLLATLLTLIGGFSGDGGSALAGLGLLIGLPALICGPLAALLGLIALTNPHTATTAFGRRHAAIGAFAGLATLLLCCVIFVFAAVQGSETGGSLPPAVTVTAIFA